MGDLRVHDVRGAQIELAGDDLEVLGTGVHDLGALGVRQEPSQSRERGGRLGVHQRDAGVAAKLVEGRNGVVGAHAHELGVHADGRAEGGYGVHQCVVVRDEAAIRGGAGFD